MPLIVIKENEGPVFIEVSVTGLVSWRYQYQADSTSFTELGEDDEPREHSLGTPSDLHMDSHAWVFHLVNAGDREQKYEARIVWRQGRRKLDEWKSQTNKVEALSVESESGSAILFVTS